MNRLLKQFLGVNPFDGDSKPSRVRLFAFGSDRPTLPFPHPGNYSQPLKILETFFWEAEKQVGPARHNRYLAVAGFSPILVTRDPGIIRAVLQATGDQPGQFDRDPLPSTGIARATGKDTLLFANGPNWRMQRRLASCPFNKSTLFQPERFGDFEDTFRLTIRKRIEALEIVLKEGGQKTHRIALELEIKAVMLEMLVNNFFGAQVPYEEIRNKFAPALERVIEHIVSDTVVNKIGIPVSRLPTLTPSMARIKKDYAVFEELTTIALSPRQDGRGLWSQFKSDAPDAHTCPVKERESQPSC